jgi:hypothetical protein
MMPVVQTASVPQIRIGRLHCENRLAEAMAHPPMVLDYANLKRIRQALGAVCCCGNVVQTLLSLGKPLVVLPSPSVVFWPPE